MSARSPTGIRRYQLTDTFRNFWFLVYPDSAPSDWMDRLHDMSIPCYVSPLHEPEEGSEDEYKSHYHVIMCFSAKKSIDMALMYIDLACESGAKVRKDLGYTKFVIGDLPAAAKYLCHIGEKDKPLYDPSDVIEICQPLLPYELVITIDKDRDLEILGEMTCYVVDNHVTNFAKFQKWCFYENKDWFQMAARSATLYMVNLIKAERYNVDS